MMTLLLSLALSATTLNAAAEPAPATTQAAKPAKPKKVCEKIEVTGSTVPKRVCRTIAEPTPPKNDAVQADAEKPSSGATN